MQNKQQLWPLFDSHLHIIDPRYPLIENQGYLPEASDCQAYLEAMSAYDLRGGAIVSGSFQGFDQDYLVAALQALGPGFVGVTQVPETIPDEDLSQLNDLGVRAVRFNLRRGGSADVRSLENLALRVFDLFGWHVELYVDARDLGDLKSRLLRLPAFSIDHLGLSQEGLPDLLELVDAGARVKATGFGRLDFDPVEAIVAIDAINPGALMFGSDLPSTRAPRPYRHEDWVQLVEAVGEQGAQRVLHDNAASFYRL